MSRIMEKVTRPAYESLVCRCRKCDLCGKESKGEDWDTAYYEINETDIHIKIKQKEGDNYPDGGSGTEYVVDLCPDCFKNRLIPWLKSEGANIEPVDWDW